MKVHFSKTFLKFFESISPQDKKYILQKIDDFTNDSENLDIKKLQPKHLGYYRLRAGKYRMIYFYDTDSSACFLKIDKRDTVYFNF